MGYWFSYGMWDRIFILAISILCKEGAEKIMGMGNDMAGDENIYRDTSMGYLSSVRQRTLWLWRMLITAMMMMISVLITT